MLRLLNWNIWQGGGTRTGQIMAWIEHFAPDVAVLCEVRRNVYRDAIQDGLAALGLAHHVYTEAPRKNTSSVLIAARWPILPLAFDGIEPAHLFAGGIVRGPVPFQVMGTHVPNRDGTRRKERFLRRTRAILLAESPLPRLFAGDLNLGQRGRDEQTAFAKDYEHGFYTALVEGGWTDCFRALHPEREAYSWFSRQGNGFRLDHVFAWGAWTVRRCDYEQAARHEGASDHAPLLAELAWPDS